MIRILKSILLNHIKKVTKSNSKRSCNCFIKKPYGYFMDRKKLDSRSKIEKDFFIKKNF